MFHQITQLAVRGDQVSIPHFGRLRSLGDVRRMEGFLSLTRVDLREGTNRVQQALAEHTSAWIGLPMVCHNH
jgi:hypothetical protein